MSIEMPAIKYKMLVVEYNGNTYRVSDFGLKGFRFEKYDDASGFNFMYDDDVETEFNADERYNIEMLFDL